MHQNPMHRSSGEQKANPIAPALAGGSGDTSAARLPRPAGLPPRPLPRWVNLLLGRWIRRFCLVRHDCQRRDCRLRPLCQCAQADFAAARSAEAWVWILVGTCAVAVLAWALVW